ncbi:hypothetical protein [Hymenobacter antarcticus]|uniref:hypothetical protein n=1 Tax=Hymenobacter antarcticus TaxID=486270 RepID=UPI0031F00D45
MMQPVILHPRVPGLGAWLCGRPAWRRAWLVLCTTRLRAVGFRLVVAPNFPHCVQLQQFPSPCIALKVES